MNPASQGQDQFAALKQLLAQQGGGSSVLNQMTPQSGMQKPNVVQNLPVQPGMTAPGSGPIGTSLAGTPEPGMGQQPLANAGTPQGTGLPAGDPEAMTILKALSTRLGTLGKLGR